MILSNLRFAGFQWRRNPLSIYADQKRILSGYTTCGESETVQRVCEDVSHIKGEGELTGSDCIEQYEELERLFKKCRKGILTLPGMKPFEAYFTKLSVKGDPAPDKLCYEFEFVRDRRGKGKEKRYHICKEGETLFDISYDYSVDRDNLARLNPQLCRADALKKGQRVRVW